MATVILAGGMSSRMGRDKAALPAEESTLLQSLVSRFSAELGPVIVVLRPGQELQVDGSAVAHDILSGVGPLGGLHAGILNSPDEINFVLACDLPLADPELARYIISRTGSYDAVVPRLERGIEPLFAAYRKTCVHEIEAALNAGESRMRDLLNRVKTLYPAESELRNHDPDLRSFLNVNTPDDYDKYLQLSGAS